MRISIAICAVFAFAASVSSSVVPSAAKDKKCNPSYNVKKSAPCSLACNTAAGKSYYKNWTMNRTSKHFIPSLAIMCDKSGSHYGQFMTKAGLCMAKCPDDPQLYNKEYLGACAWWNKHKKDKC